jgi:hypothetical protein
MYRASIRRWNASGRTHGALELFAAALDALADLLYDPA